MDLLNMSHIKIFILASLLAAGVVSFFVYGLSFLVPALRAGTLIPTLIEAISAIGGGSFAVWRASRDEHAH
jgi:hypothetical protein